MRIQATPTVLAASDDPSLLDEIVRHLEENPHWKLVTAGGSSAELMASAEAHLPEAILISDGLARDLARRGEPAPFYGRIIVVGRQEQTKTLKAALRLQARGFVLWPKEKSQLKELVEGDWVVSPASKSSSSGRLHTVWAPKAGSGASTLAAHLAGAIKKSGGDCLLVDADLDNADQTAILGVKDETKNLADLLRMADEISRSIVDGVTWTHPAGFRVVLSPGDPGQLAIAKPSDLMRVLDSIQAVSDHVIVDAPSGISEISFALIEQASTVLMVVTPDLLSLRRARQAMQSITAAGHDHSKVQIVLNQTGGPGVSAKEVRAVLGRPLAAEIRADIHLYQSANRGEVSSTGTRMLSKLGRTLMGVSAPKTDQARRFAKR